MLILFKIVTFRVCNSRVSSPSAESRVDPSYTDIKNTFVLDFARAILSPASDFPER